MPVRFKSADLQPVLAEAMQRHSCVVLVKDQGVYFMASGGERTADGRQKTLAYAVGCNPQTDAFEDWWARAHDAFGGDDFGEFFDPKDVVFARVIAGDGDLEVSATATHIQLQTAMPLGDAG